MKDGPILDSWAFKRGALVYPQPVAAACGRVLRATNDLERIDSCLKAAEILVRYLSSLALSSLCGRDSEEFPQTIKPLAGNLAFGHYLSLVQAVAKSADHPLYQHFGPFRPKGKGKNKKPGAADSSLVALLELRNDIGHDLASMSKARAITILKTVDPLGLLVTALQALDGVLALPLFVLDNFQLRDRQVVAQRLMLMGENPDPLPDDIALSGGLDPQIPYVALDSRILVLPPIVVFALIEEDAAYRIAFLDSVLDGKLRFKTMKSRVFEDSGDIYGDLQALFGGELRIPDEVTHVGGQSFCQEWRKARSIREDAGRKAEGIVDWTSFDQESLDWYAKRLPSGEVEGLYEKITLHLLDGRTRGIGDEELRQLKLLFGKEKQVRGALGRDLYDFRVMADSEKRWKDRQCGSSNILSAMKIAVGIFSGQFNIDSASGSDLSCDTGSPDYIAMREALVNLFIHQDFSDDSAAAQIELSPNQAVFFNPGHSLVPTDQLVDGGRSQARNPLVARAFRLIGFAELAGSGIRALQREWRNARRRPPVLQSDRTGNSFSLTLDWHEIPSEYDPAWQEKLGVRLTSNQASILNLANIGNGISAQQAASATGLRMVEVAEDLRFLVHQVLLEERDGVFVLKPHLKEVMK
jgi:hypothetical protein